MVSDCTQKKTLCEQYSAKKYTVALRIAVHEAGEKDKKRKRERK